MFYVISWFIVFSLLALWSLASWALHAIGVWTVSSAGALSGAASGVGAIGLPEWLAPWVPQALLQPLTALLSGLEPVVSSLVQALPALAGGVTVVSWVVWGIGAALLLLLGAGLHLLIALWRRRDHRPGPPAGRVLSAG